jgi:ankyrin repeat protein
MAKPRWCGRPRKITRKRQRSLIAHGADVNARSNPLERSKDRFGLEGVLTILPHGNWTPLMYAARQGSLDAARTLVDRGATLNLTDPDGSTALLLAIINGHYDTAALLAEKGADPNIADTSGMAALYAAVDMSTLGEVYGHPARPNPSKMTALDLMKVLLAHGANPNARLKTPTTQRAHTPGEPTLNEGSTPLMRAAKNGDSAALRLLLANGADPNARAEERHHSAHVRRGHRIWHGYFRERLCNSRLNFWNRSRFWWLPART